MWKKVCSDSLPDAPEDAATIGIDVPFHNRMLSRAITVSVVGDDAYAGLVIHDGKITGMWRWSPSRFANPVFISNLWVDELGHHKRYAGGLPICNVIRSLMLSYLEDAARVAA